MTGVSRTDPRRPTRRDATLVFVNANRNPINAADFSRTWATARAKVGLPARWGIHGLRHYYATVLIHAGASVKTVQLALGHSTPIVTQHVRPRVAGPGRPDSCAD